VDEGSSTRCLLCRIGAGGEGEPRAGERLLAIDLQRVVETMRPLPIEAFPSTASWVLGVSLIRDDVVPVVDVGALLGAPCAPIERFVTIALGPRTVALAVSAVVGVEMLAGDVLAGRPPLLGSVDPEALSAIGALDGELLLALGGARLVPDPVWASLDGQGVTS
jgi:purine-binding chemotaxis protein CheW